MGDLNAVRDTGESGPECHDALGVLLAGGRASSPQGAVGQGVRPRQLQEVNVFLPQLARLYIQANTVQGVLVGLPCLQHTLCTFALVDLNAQC